MAQAKRGAKPNSGLVWGAAIAVLLLGGLGIFMVKDSGAEKVAAPTATPELPTGRLVVLERGVKDVRFLALDEIRPAGGTANAVVMTVAKAAGGLSGGASIIVHTRRVVCADGRLFDGPTGHFDHDGRLLQTEIFYNAKRGRPIESGDADAKLVCGASPGAGQRAFAGFHAAQREVQMPPDDYEPSAGARADDPQYWAWLCAAGARGRRREAAPQDCDQAVKLAPASAETGLDRAFLHLKRGETQPADVAFKAVLAQHPHEAMALYGRGLSQAIASGGSGGADLRSQGLAIDPKIPAAIEARYGFYIDAQYKR